MDTILEKNSRIIDAAFLQSAFIRLASLSRDPQTSVERLVVSALKAHGSLPFSSVVERVASELYQEELRHGAWVLDIGLFGSRLFVPDIIDEIEARDGMLWHIEKSKD